MPFSELFQQVFPDAAFDALWMAFHDFDRLFSGSYRDFVGCDTVYHDRQHSLDITLAMARLLAGYELSSAAEDRLGSERAVLGIIAALAFTMPATSGAEMRFSGRTAHSSPAGTYRAAPISCGSICPRCSWLT